VKQIQVDYLNTHALQLQVAALPYVRRRQIRVTRTVRIEVVEDFSADHDGIAGLAGQEFSEDCFGIPISVSVCCIEEVYPGVEGRVHRGQYVCFRLFAPETRAQLPRTKAYW